MDLETRVDRPDLERVERDLRAARYKLPNAVREALRESAEEEALPSVRMVSPTFAQPILTARSTMRQAYITTRGPKKADRILGLLNYGGTVRTRIVPRQVTRAAARVAKGKAPVARSRGAVALRLPGGLMRAAVDTPRHYEPQFFLEHAVDASVPAMAHTFLDKSLAIFSGLHTTKEG